MNDSDKKEQTQGSIRITAQIVRVTPHAWHPATDLFETPDEYIIKVEIAGLTEQDFAVSMDENTVVVSGMRPLVNPEGAFHRLEIPYGDFISNVEIPNDVDRNQIVAFYQNGFLTINLPKTQPVKIRVNQA